MRLQTELMDFYARKYILTGLILHKVLKNEYYFVVLHTFHMWNMDVNNVRFCFRFVLFVFLLL